MEGMRVSTLAQAKTIFFGAGDDHSCLRANKDLFISIRFVLKLSPQTADCFV